MDSKSDQRDENYSHLNWLKRIQEQSWEPEILISGIVLFALLQLPPLIREFFSYLDSYSLEIFSIGTADESLLAILLTANYWLIAGFTAHLISRSVWVAFVGLSYVYKKGVDLSRLNYRKPYRKILERNTDYIKNIISLEKICSSVFAVSFLIFMTTLGVFFFLTVVVAVLAITFELAPDFATKYDSWIDPILSIIALFTVIDFIGLGLIKRIPVVSRIYYPFYRLMSVLTLSPLYRNIYYGFISNHRKWKVGVAMAVFVLISFLIAKSIRTETNPLNLMTLKVSEDSRTLFHGHYENLMGDEPSKRIHIPSDVISSNVLPVFIVMNAGMQQRYITDACDYNTLKTVEMINLDSLKMECLSSFYNLRLDGNEVEAEFLYHLHQKTSQEGIMTYLDISGLEKGMHQLELYYPRDDEEKLSAIVEFYKVAPVEDFGSRSVTLEESSLQSDSVEMPVQD